MIKMHQIHIRQTNAFVSLWDYWVDYESGGTGHRFLVGQVITLCIIPWVAIVF